MKWRPPVTVVTLALNLAPLSTAAADSINSNAGAHSAETSRELRLQALDLAYNLDHDQAIELLRRAVAQSPGDPAPHRSLASVLWLNLLFRRGAVTVDHYLGSFSRSTANLAKPPPDIDRDFRVHVERAISLAEQRVRANPKDAQAHYDLGAAVGLQASYVATVEGKMLAGFRAARRCYDEHETVIDLDRSRKDAGLIVGTYRYVVSTLSLPMRMMAYVAGFGGGRDRGIQMLRETAELGDDSKPRAGATGAGNDASADALFALVLMYNRERQYDEALRALQELRRRYPRNRLLFLEAGATALRAGRWQQSEDLLTEGMARLAKEQRARIPGEEALWRYKRGAARAGLGRTEEALADLRMASGADSQEWVHGRARVEIGRLALKRGDRGAAALEARQGEALCERGNDPSCVQDARALLRSSNGR
jgi:tetratricopeptide (TPR) repeat protein